MFINIIGHNASGKTTLSKKLAHDLNLNRISGDDFREFVHGHVAYFENTDISFPNKKYDQLSPLVIEYRLSLTALLLAAGESVLFDGSGSTRAYRDKYLNRIQVDFPDVTRVIVWSDVSEEILIERLSERGEKWLEQYDELKKQSFQPPETSDNALILRYDQSNYEHIKIELEKILE